MKEKNKRMLKVRIDGAALLFCIVTALIFWFFNAMNRYYTSEINYPLRIKYDQRKFVPVTKLPEKIRINVSGHGWNLLSKNLGLNNHPLVIKPENLPKKKYISEVEIASHVSNQLEDVQLNYIAEDSIKFKFDYLSKKKVKVWVDSAGISLATGYKLSSDIIASPDSIDVEGAESQIKKIDSVRVAINKKEIKKEFKDKVKISENFPPQVNVSDKEIQVKFDVDEF